MVQAPPKPSTGMPSTGLVLIGLLLVATTLRAPVTAVGPIIETLRGVLDLSATTAGLVTALPLVAFGVIAPFAGLLGRRFGLERCLVVSLAIVVLGILLRSYGSVAALFAGTALLGVGIAIGNVLMPSVIKRDFPSRVPSITGRCGMAIGLSAAAASSLAVPLMSGLGWQVALGSTAVFPLLAVIVWARLSSRPVPAPAPAAANSRAVSPWMSPLAWQVTAFMTINSVLFYAVITWLPSILTSYGMSKAQAGSIHGFLQLASLIPGLLLGPIVARMKDQRLLAVGLGLLQVCGLSGIILAPEWSAAWAFMFGLGTGGALILSLMFIGLRTVNTSQAVGLSGMAQCVNFLLGALGPLLAGRAQELVGGWVPILSTGIVLALLMALAGMFAGRKVTMSAN